LFGAAKSRLIAALDVPTLADARALAEELRGEVGMLKVGLELFVAEGAAAVRLGQDNDLPVFLDLKLHDIPETVERAVSRASALGARLLTVHASGGRAMLERAVTAAERGGQGLEIVAVTVLTSLDDADLAELGLEGGAPAQAVRLARLAFACGVRTFVCSPHEAAALRAALGPSARLVTPGVRPGGEAAGDQKRVATPATAITAGADALVIGRPLRDAPNRRDAARALVAEIDTALRGRP
jgi:orotidine-5'-phosphate decarboxylase